MSKSTKMAFTELELQRIKKQIGGLCTRRTPAQFKDQLRFDYKIENHSVVINEIRPDWRNPAVQISMPFAKLTFVKSKNIWKLYWKRASGKWETYGPKESSKELSTLVKEIEDDRYGCFFG